MFQTLVERACPATDNVGWRFRKMAPLRNPQFWHSFLGLHQGSMDRHASTQLKKENAGTGTVI